MRITYPFHPRCGESVPVFRRFAYRGVDLVVIPQPDGSVACIPEWMTHERAMHLELSAEPCFQLEILRSMRAEADALLVARFIQIEGYRCLSLMRALAVVKCQSALAWLAFRSCSQAATSVDEGLFVGDAAVEALGR